MHSFNEWTKCTMSWLYKWSYSLYCIPPSFFLHFSGPSNHPRLCHGPQRTTHPSSWWSVWRRIRPHHKLRRQHSSSGRSAEERSGGGRSVRWIHRLRGAAGFPRHSLPAAHPRCLPDILIVRVRPRETATKMPCLWLNDHRSVQSVPSYRSITWNCERPKALKECCLKQIFRKQWSNDHLTSHICLTCWPQHILDPSYAASL